MPSRITTSPDLADGKPCIRDLGLPISTILELLAAGKTQANILETHPRLEAADISETLGYAALQAGKPEKTYWEIRKLELETQNLARPFWQQVASWAPLVTIALSVLLNVVLYQKADVEKHLGEAKSAQAASMATSTTKSLATADQQLQDVQQRVQILSQQVSAPANDRGADRAQLLKSIAEIEKATSAVSRTTASATEQVEALAPNYVASRNYAAAREQERDGFQFLIDNKFDAALKAFQASEEIVNGYHYVYEISRLIRQRRKDLDDPDKRKEVFRTIVTQYAGGAPKDVIDRLRELSKA